MTVKKCICLEEEHCRVVYGMLVTAHAHLVDLSRSKRVSERDITVLGLIIDEFALQLGMSFVKPATTTTEQEPDND